MGSCILLNVKSGTLGGTLAHALAGEVHAVSVVHQPVENGVGNGRIGDHLVPVLDVHLAGDDRAAASVPIVEDFEQVTALIRRQVGKPPVIEDQQLDTGNALHEPGVPAVAARERQGIEQPWHPMIEHGSIVSAGLVG